MNDETDRELLELAAKAAGLRVERSRHGLILAQCVNREQRMGSFWNPLTDDGDALRLAVKLKIDLSLWIWSDCVEAKTHIGAGSGIPLHGDYTPPVNNHREPNGADPCAATRRAIVRAAAEIGRAMK